MVVVVIMTVAVVVVVVMVVVIFVMSVGMTVGLMLFFVDPIARVVAIAALEMFILRVRPDGSGIRWTLIVSGDPAI